MAQLIKPIYIKDSELYKEENERISNFDLLEAVSHCISADAIKCIQLDRNLWRIYFTDKQSRDSILCEGFDFKNHHISVYDSNPYSAGLEHPSDESLKVTICGVPLSVDDSAILEMLSKLGAHPKSELKYEKIRNPANNKMTSVLNGNRFIYIEPLTSKPLPRFSYCAGLKCKILHRGQNSDKPTILCTKCWKNDHYTRNCQNEQSCAACKKPGHEPGSSVCAKFVADPKNVATVQGAKHVLSNFYPCDLKIFGENFKSAEQAYQLTKAIRTGNLVAADKIRDAKSALECKLIGNTVTNTPQWRDEAEDVMEKILCAKIDQLKEMNYLLASSRPHTIFAHSVYDLYWGTGLDSEKTAHTAPDAWPGQNKFGKLLQRLADKRRTKPRSVSMSRAVKTRQQGIDKYTC